MAAAGTLAVAACGGQIAANTPASNGISFVSGNGSATFFKAGSRTAAPDISGTTLTGSRFSLSSYRGKVVVINFCSPASISGTRRRARRRSCAISASATRA
jgi:hypothetical protein